MVKHVKGDIFQSNADVILHQVNCQGVMGSGIAKQVREKYPYVYEEYKKWCSIISQDDLLGKAQFVNTRTKHNTSFGGIVNLFAQRNYGYDGKCYTNYDSLRKALEWVRNCVIDGRTIAIPYLMGCHRGGGDWNIVYKMIEEVFADCDVTLYEYNGG